MEKSSRPAEEPALRMTASHCSRACSRAATMSSSLSFTMGKVTGWAPHWRSMAEKMVELNSMISPSPGSARGGTISSPVGMMPMTGLRKTSTSRMPAASMAPMAAGVMRAWEVRSISWAHTSSPIWRMCCQGAAAL